MKYQECSPIHTRFSSVWLVELPDGRRLLEVLDVSFTVETVHDFLKVHYPGGFRFSIVDVGQFEIEKTIDAYFPDSRKVDMDWEVSI